MKNFTFNLIMAILYIVMGLIMIFAPLPSEIGIVMVLGIMAIVYGIVCIVRYVKGFDGDLGIITDLLFGILLLISGIYVIFHIEGCAAVFPFVWGVFMIVDAIIRIPVSIRYRKVLDIPIWIIIISIVVPAILGILLVITPIPAVISLIMVIGIFVTVIGVVDLIAIIYMHHQVKKLEKNF